MPREGGESSSAASTKPTERVARAPSGSIWVQISPNLKEELRPFVDLDEVESEGFEVWLHSILPILPRGPVRPVGRPASDPRERISELARALAECSGDRAKVHFQAAAYYRENQVMARRIRALEAVIRTRGSSEEQAALLEPEPEVERASERYLPNGRDGQ